jgi:hypothetical protein
MGAARKALPRLVVVTIGALGGSFEIWAEDTAPTISRPEASCNDDAVREMVVLFVRKRGINNPVLGEAHNRGGYCEIMVTTDAKKDVGHMSTKPAEQSPRRRRTASYRSAHKRSPSSGKTYGGPSDGRPCI